MGGESSMAGGGLSHPAFLYLIVSSFTALCFCSQAGIMPSRVCTGGAPDLACPRRPLLSALANEQRPWQLLNWALSQGPPAKPKS